MRVPHHQIIKLGSRTKRPVFVREPRVAEGVHEQKRQFSYANPGSQRGFGREIGLFCYRRVGQPGGSVAKSGLFATEGWVRQGVRSQNRAILLPKGGSVRGFGRKIGLFCYRRVGSEGWWGSPPQYTPCGGGRMRHHRRAMAKRGGYGRAVGSSGVICTPKVRQKTFGYAYKTWNERKAYVCQHA